MSSFDDLRIAREPAATFSIREEYRKRSWRRLYTLGPLILVCFGAAFLQQHHVAFVDSIAFRALLCAAAVVVLGFHYFNWRCPACNVFFGKRWIVGRCPACLAELKG